jgi:predicted NBD/HSP70 family sugar kinase/putative N-acetylmannosamine-6-phosphate epimerase
MSYSIPVICRSFEGRLIVSCQAAEGDAFRTSDAMARFARAALDGGAMGIRAEGAEDIAAIRAAVDLPIIGIRKSQHEDGGILITPTFEDARALVAAGADMIALDCTARGERYGALERLRRIRAELGVPVLADIATVAEGVAAAAAGADFVLSTMRGYTQETRQFPVFEPEFIAALRQAVPVPVIAEGRIWTPEEARAAMAAGAFAVIVGTAITRPHEITRRFARAVAAATPAPEERCFIGVDLGGTNIKSGLVTEQGALLDPAVRPTPATAGAPALLQSLREVVEEQLHRARQRDIEPVALGLATAGWVEPTSGRIIYASENLPGWTGAEPGRLLAEAGGLPVTVINDANALAVAEHRFGSARGVDDFLCLTLGTGIGGGLYLGGRLHQGAHFMANALGHLCIEPGGRPCTCGRRGCVEMYANAAALLRYAGEGFSTPEQVIAAAGQGDPQAGQAMQIFAGYLARGAALAIDLLDPASLILAGGLVQDNPLLLDCLRRELSPLDMVPHLRQLELRVSSLGYQAGVIGAAAAAMERYLPG